MTVRLLELSEEVSFLTHALEESGGGGRGGDGDAHGRWKFGRGGRGAEEGADGGGGVEVRYFLGEEEAPDCWVVDFAEAVVGAADGG